MADTQQQQQQPAEGSTSNGALENAAAAPTKSAQKKAQKQEQAAKKAAAKAAERAAKQDKAAASPGSAPAPKRKEKQAAPEDPPPIEVPEGHKKDMSQTMASGYNPIHVESAWYPWWSQQGFFRPMAPAKQPSEFSHWDFEPRTLPRDPATGDIVDSELAQELDKDKTFVIPVPPPNVTGSLHIGHALAFTIQDTLIRWHRMRGFTTLFVPGYDHAGISTQSVVEKRLAKLTGQTRHDLGREAFVQKCYDWKDEYQQRITKQVKRLGASTDWERVAFTMNDSLSTAVAETFVRLHDDGIIYRANRLVNWCVKLNTTLSNLEVDQKVLAGRTLLNVPGYDLKEKFEFGVITSFAYEIDGSSERIVIATTRPETMLGDTAIAVHPDDERYKHLHGKFARHPFVDRLMPIICDPIAVDMSFGTGAVKMTPAHDPNDYETGMRNKLEFVNILNDDGTLNENAGPRFSGMKRFHARVAVIDELKRLGLYVDAADNPMSLPVCSKSGDIIETVMKPQWWVSCKTLADKAIERTRAGELKVRPDQSEREWYAWLENIQDWCISRQLWWGHRAPAYFVNVKGDANQDRLSGANWVVGRSREEAQKRAEDKFAGKEFTLEQDDDVLDTWFSSGLWPWSIEGWPRQTLDLEKFYPSSLLETGWDILFFWVARMVMLGIYLTGKMPFSEVYCHAMIRDAHGRKMSKSLGNVIDFLDVIEGATLETLHAQLRAGNLDEREVVKAEAGQKKDFPKGIPQCGADGLRFALANYSGGGRDINLEILRVEGYRKFCNKIWNATRFALLKLEGDFNAEASEKPTGRETLVEKWILHKLNKAAAAVNKELTDRNFMNATNTAYAFFYEICDVYIEAIKPITDPAAPADGRKSAQNTLYTVLDNSLRLLHPFMPFVTEELWQRLGRRPGDGTKSIMLARYPQFAAEREFATEEQHFDTIVDGVKAGRSLSVNYNVKTNVQLFFHARDPALAAAIRESSSMAAVLIKGCSALEVVESEGDVPLGCITENVSKTLAVHLLVKGMVDVDAEMEKVNKKREVTQDALQRLQKQMNQPNYESKVGEATREANTQKCSYFEIEIDSLSKAYENLLSLRD